MPAKHTRRNGAMIPLLALIMVILFIAVVYSVDVSRMHVTRAELRTATDAAARAGVEALSRTQDVDLARSAAINIASMNKVAGKPLTLRPDQVEFGQAESVNGEVFSFQAATNFPNAVRVTASRSNGSPDGPVALFFAPLFGVTHFETELVSSAVKTDRDIALVLDVSGSMALNNRFDGLKDALEAFFDELARTPQKERVSLVVYSSTARKLVDMTPDLLKVEEAFDKEKPNGRTAIGLGLEEGIKTLNGTGSRQYAKKAVLLMTDGNQNTGISPDIVAKNNPATTIHTVTFGADANQALMQKVAETNGGVFLHATNNDDLVDVFRKIARQLSVMLIE